MTSTPVSPPLRLAIAAVVAAVLAGCSTGGGGGLSAGLAARMDQPGAQLDRTEALGIVNHYRAAASVPPLAGDAALDSTAQALATAYAASGQAPALPAGAVAIRISAGYPNFAETFSGWRNSPADAAVLAERAATRGGVGVAYQPNSTYGVYWVLLLDD